MKQLRNPKSGIENSWMKLESIFDITPFKSSRKLQPSHKKSNASVSIRKSTNRSNNKSPSDSPEPQLNRSITPSLSVSRPSPQIDGITQAQLKLLYHAKCEDLKIPVLPDQQFRFFSFCFKHFSRRRFEMQEAGLGEISALAIGEILQDNSNFSYVILGQNMFGDSGVLHLSKLLQRNLCLVHLDISSNNITPEGSEEILKSLSMHQSLVSLDISSHEGLHRNRLSTPGALGLNSLLMRSSLISYLNVCGTSISDGVESIFRGIERSMQLTSMNLGNNAIGGECIRTLMKALEHSSLLELDISINLLGNEGCDSVAEFLLTNSALEKIDLGSNGISSRGVKKIFDSLSNNSHLRILNLENNPLQNGPTDEIVYFLATNTTIESLNLGNCMLKNEGVLLVAEGLAKNRSLECLKLNLNSIGDSGVEGISLAFLRNQTLKTIDLANNRIKNQGAVLLANGLRGNSSIQDVNLKENTIKDEGGLELVEVTRTNTNIIRFCLELNQVNSKCLANIKENMKNNLGKCQKGLPVKLKRQTETVNFDEDAIKKVMQKIQLKKKEKDEIKQRIDKNYEKMEEIRESEAARLKALQDTLAALRLKNQELSLTLEQLQSLLMKSRVGGDREINELNNKHAVVDAEILKYEKRSNS